MKIDREAKSSCLLCLGHVRVRACVRVCMCVCQRWSWPQEKLLPGPSVTCLGSRPGRMGAGSQIQARAAGGGAAAESLTRVKGEINIFNLLRGN